MGKKRDQSLTERINALISRASEKPDPPPGYLKSELVECRNLAEALEESTVIRDAEAKITVLEKALEDLNAEKEELEGELQSLRTEVEGFKEEQRERERKIDPMLFKILKRLPSQSLGRGLSMEEISRLLHIRLDELEVYMNGLRKLGFITEHRHAVEGLMWLRSEKGNEFVVAKRWAGEDEAEDKNPQPKARKYANLSLEEGLALKFMAEKGATAPSIMKGLELVHGQGKISLQKTELILLNLAEKEFAAIEDEMTYGAPLNWILRKKGMEYLAERDQL